MSHEFQILAQTGESTLYYDKKLLTASDEELMNIFAVTDEKYDPKTSPIPKNELMVSKGIEVGHIFYFGKKYSEPMNAFVLDKNGQKLYPEMGSYGIGVSRLIAAIIEAFHDERGIMWPEHVAPFDVTVLNLHTSNKDCVEICNKIYRALSESKEVLYDDREMSIGEKLGDADLIGIPWQIIVGEKNLSQGFVELKNRKTKEIIKLSVDEVIGRFIGK